MPFAMDGEKLLRHYAACMDSASAQRAAATDPIEQARAEGAFEAFAALFRGLVAALEKAGLQVTVRTTSAPAATPANPTPEE